MATTIKLRRGSAAQWASVDPVLHDGEVGVEVTPGSVHEKFKIGDGVLPWSQLAYFISESAIDEKIQAWTGDDVPSLVQIFEDGLVQE